ncbi:NDR1/HIN1-like protein 13 [Phoenix dactylifera]|uniref:NDR1/HIN1-like protein 13 n=1 Tax=Phoenix dactylifera TaxID=42345 RepID=A0A8B7CBE6_PHODC|nr:NDR1/HIN1-like protein 13 [Phoenix dactylifera]
MAERAAPLPPPPPPLEAKPAAAPANPSPTPRLTETYVVQVPKEQIYRIPPPENAKLVEQYRNNHNNRHQRRPIIPCLKWTIGIAVVAGILAATIAIIYFLVVRPADPSFSVTRLVLKNIPNPRGGSPPKPEYHFTMSVDNPSLRMGYSYVAGGKAILAHHGVEIAVGKTQAFHQGYQNTTTYQLVLQGSHILLPKQIQSSLKGSKDVIPLSLMIEFSVRKTIGVLEMGNKSMDVTCDIKVSGLTKEARIVSQGCKSKFT